MRKLSVNCGGVMETFTCELHQYPCEYLCFDCDESLICANCVALGHPKHRIGTIEKQAYFWRNFLNNQMEAAEAAIHCNDSPYCEDIANLIAFRQQVDNELSARIVKVLTHHLNELNNAKEKILMTVDEKIKSFEQNLKVNHQLEKDLKGNLNAFKDQLSIMSDAKLVSTVTEIEEKLKDLASVHYFKAYLKHGDDNGLGECMVQSGKNRPTEYLGDERSIDVQIEWIYTNGEDKASDFCKLWKELTTFEENHKAYDKEFAKVRKFLKFHYTFEDACQMISTNRLEDLTLVLRHQPEIGRIKLKYDRTLLHKAAQLGKFDAMKVLLEETKENVNSQNIDGNTALMYACRNGHHECVSILLKHQSHVNARNNDGNTSLMLACGAGHVECVEVLLKHQADLNDQGYAGCTALMLAVQNKHEKCVHALLRKNVDTKLRNEHGETAFDIATKNGSGTIAKFL